MHKRLVEEILMLDNGQGRYSVAELAFNPFMSSKTVERDADKKSAISCIVV